MEWDKVRWSIHNFKWNSFIKEYRQISLPPFLLQDIGKAILTRRSPPLTFKCVDATRLYVKIPHIFMCRKNPWKCVNTTSIIVFKDNLQRINVAATLPYEFLLITQKLTRVFLHVRQFELRNCEYHWRRKPGMLLLIYMYKQHFLIQHVRATVSWSLF